MKKVLLSLGGAALAVLVVTATVLAAGPGPNGLGGGSQVVESTLGLSQAEVMELRHEGLSLAQIAEGQGVATQVLVDALTTEWSARIDARVENGALTEAEAATLKESLAARAQAMVTSTELGGMQGAVVGAGPTSAGGLGDGTGLGAGPSGRGSAGAMAGPGAGGGTGTGVCDGTGPHGNGRS